MHRIVVCLVAALLAGCATPPPASPGLPAADALREKTLPLLGLIERDPATLAALAHDPDLSDIGRAYRARLAEADRTCGPKAACHTAAGKLTQAETARAEAALRRLAAETPAVARFSDGPLKASGIAALHDAELAPDRLAAAWRTSAAMMAGMVSVYGEAGPTRYPAIDAMREDPKSDAFGRMMRTLTGLMTERHAHDELFLEAPADYALAVMQSDGRDEAGRHEPMTQGENRAAASAMPGIDWKRYPYTAILVPGLGPDVDGVRLHPGARLRLRLALERFHAGKAPLIIVSGGYVHPSRTPYCEAIEMKRALIADYGVPESAILVDPHARHTTTNVRNAARLLFHLKAPGGKMLVITDEGQTAAIAADSFDVRNRTETGVVPYRNKHQLSRYEVELEPSRDALELDPGDPLDP